MESGRVQLRFGTALFTFRDMEQMKAFCEHCCYKDGKGRIFLHHGAQYHEFTELAREYYRRLPSDVMFPKHSRTHFMLGKYGGVGETGFIFSGYEAEHD